VSRDDTNDDDIDPINDFLFIKFVNFIIYSEVIIYLSIYFTVLWTVLFVMERAGLAYQHLFQVMKIKKLLLLTMLYNFFKFKLIESWIVLVRLYSKLWYASFPCKITIVWNF